MGATLTAPARSWDVNGDKIRSPPLAAAAVGVCAARVGVARLPPRRQWGVTEGARVVVGGRRRGSRLGQLHVAQSNIRLGPMEPSLPRRVVVHVIELEARAAALHACVLHAIGGGSLPDV